MKNPDLRWRLLEEEVPKLAQLQYELLLAGLKMLKPGGYLLYSTCSLLREQGEDVIQRVIKKKKAKIVPIKGPYEEGFLPGTMRAWPHKHNTTGFFYALLTKG
jgi:16S rRNA (cytosine967-C5)-methyltransferase